MQENDATYWSRFYNEGFFGFGVTNNFSIGSLEHIVPIILALILLFLIYKYRDIFKKNTKLDNIIITTLTILMIFAELTYWWRLIYVGPGLDNVHDMFGKLPIQVCQWTLLITVCALISKSNTLVGTSFFLVSFPSLFAICLPTVLVKTGPFYFRYYQYWLEHLLPIISIYYMVFVHDYKIKFKHILYALFVLTVLFFVGSKANTLLDENITTRYLYMNYMRDIPFLSNTNDIELYIFCLISFFAVFFIIYRLYRHFVGKGK